VLDSLVKEERTMPRGLGNFRTTVAGLVGAVIVYAQGVGAKTPETKQEWATFAFGLVIAALGYLAKDAATGSAPGAKAALLLVAGLPLFVGCAQVQMDFKAAATRAHAAVDAGILATDDPSPACLDYLVGVGSVPGASVLGPPFVGPVDLGEDLYIIDTAAGRAGLSNALETKCGPWAFTVMRNFARHAPVPRL
jgi:hypothetical protein